MKPSLARLVAGGDLFSRQFDGSTISSRYASLGVTIRPANTNRVQGWAAILERLGDPDAGIRPTLFIHRRCTRLLDCLPFLQHDPDQPADVLKTNPNEEGLGGDDAADALRYMVATKVSRIYQVKLRGL
jgi:phage terminase large subunit